MRAYVPTHNAMGTLPMPFLHQCPWEYAPNGRLSYSNVTFPARNDIPLSTDTHPALPRVQQARDVKQDRGVMYG